jgi:hypothetical protein
MNFFQNMVFWPQEGKTRLLAGGKKDFPMHRCTEPITAKPPSPAHKQCGSLNELKVGVTGIQNATTWLLLVY